MLTIFQELWLLPIEHSLSPKDFIPEDDMQESHVSPLSCPFLTHPADHPSRQPSGFRVCRALSHSRSPYILLSPFHSSSDPKPEPQRKQMICPRPPACWLRLEVQVSIPEARSRPFSTILCPSSHYQTCSWLNVKK